MQNKITWLACLAALVVAPVVLAEDLFWVGENDDDAPRAFTLFSNTDDSAFLGVTMEEETEHEEGGARIMSVVDDSPAERAGLEEGDIVVSFGGDTVRGPVSLTKKIRDREPGDSVKITVLRDGRRQSFDVELGERAIHHRSAFSVAPGVLQQLENIQVPDVDLEGIAEHLEGLNLEHLGENMVFDFDFQNLEELQEQWGNAYSLDCEDGDCKFDSFFSFSSKPRLGVQLTDTTPELREHLGGSADAGVLVGKVIDDSAAEAAGVQVGDLIVDVDGDAIGSTGDLRKALARRDGETFDIGVIRDGRSVRLSVTLEESEEERPSGPRASFRVAPSPPTVAMVPSPESAPAPPASPTSWTVPAPPKRPVAPLAPVLRVPPIPGENVI